MPTAKRKISSLGIYHVIYRGINKQDVFEDAEDFERFLETLRKYQPICGFELLGYCLMSNHVHLIIKPGETPLGRIFQRVIPSFVYWYNRKYERVGSLFQSPFKSTPINSNDQLLTAVRDDHCMDIDDERPRLSDDRAKKIMHDLSGCDNVTQFQSLDTETRNAALRRMWEAGISVSRANRLTGVSYGVIRKAVSLAK